MNEPPRSPAVPPPRSDQATDTHSRALEATGPQSIVALGISDVSIDNEGPRQIGDYAVIQKIGQGGMGAVYLAEDARLHRKVAIKTMRPELAANKTDRDRFEREARAAAGVEHDNIVPIWYIGESTDRIPFIVMPFLQGETLDARLKREPVASLGLILKVAREVAEGLAAAHAAGLIHRDIKPGNVWLEGDLTAKEPGEQIRRCKILDFGLARSMTKEEIAITTTGAILGTPAYMAPEQARGEKVDRRADLFSLGVMLYRMATGRLPFDGPHPMAVLIALTSDTPPPVRDRAPHLPPALADLIDRLLSKEPAGRPATAREVANAVRQIVQEWKAKRAPVAPTVRSTTPPPVPKDLLAAPPSGGGSGSIPEELPDDDTEPEPTRLRPRERPQRWPLAVPIAVGLLVLVTLGWWVAEMIGKKPSDMEAAKKDEPPNSPVPKQKELKDSPKLPVPDESTNFAAERKAAEFVLASGGRFRVRGSERDYTKGQTVPAEPFRLAWVDVNSSNSVTDDALAVFAPCKHLERLDLSGTPTGNAGLSHLSGCTLLEKLELRDTQVTDAGLETIKQFNRLRDLDLRKTKVSETGVTDLASVLPECIIEWNGGLIDPWAAPDSDRAAAEWVLSVRGSVYVNSAPSEIKAIGDLPKTRFHLTTVLLTTPIKDANLAVFGGCKNIRTLSLIGTGIGNAGLAHFTGCKNLMTLDLAGTKVDNAGANIIEQFARLQDLSIGQTKIDEKGATELARALPGCTIQWNGGTLDPKK